MVASPRAPRRLLLIAPHNSYRIAPYVQAARRLDLPVLIASEGRHSLVSEIAAGLHIDLRQADAALASIRDEHHRWPFCAVVGADDASVELASRASVSLGLDHNSPEAAILSRRKDLARARLQAAGLPVPAHRVLNVDRHLLPQLAGLVYPCVVKPLALAGSRGVIRADNERDLQHACARVLPMLEEMSDPFERAHLLVESFIPGQEVALEGMLVDGVLQVLAVFDKPDPLDGPYFEETYYITPSRLPTAVCERIAGRVQEACAAYGLAQGPVHAELRVNDTDIWILEIAARTIGGQCAQLLRFGTGHGLEELVLLHAMGRRPEPVSSSGAAGVLMIPIPRAGILRRVEGLLAAQRVPGIESIEISVREGYELVPLPEGASYLGFIFARAETPLAAENALREAHACLNIVTAPVVPLRSG